MAHTIALSDEQYAKIAAMAQSLKLRLESIISELVDDLPEPRPVWTDAEYAARWHDFKRLARAFSSGGKLDALTADEYDEVLAEPDTGHHFTHLGAAQPHDRACRSNH